MDDERKSGLTKPFKEGLPDVYGEMIRQIVVEARAEAMSEAKDIIKEAMLKAILSLALDDLAVNQALGSRNLATESQTEERLRREIEVVRKRIAENEHLLNQIAMPPPELATPPQPPPARKTTTSPSASRSQPRAPVTKVMTMEEEEALAFEPQEPPPRAPVTAVIEDPDAFRFNESQNGQQGAKGHPKQQTSTNEHARAATEAYYIYGIVPDVSKQILQDLPEDGIDPDYPVAILPHRNIQAVLSKVSLLDFGQAELKANMQNVLWLESRVRVHQIILESVSTNATVVPMRFCTIYRTEDRVREMLDQHYNEFLENLLRLEGKHEWSVKIFCRTDILSERVEGSNTRVREIRAGILQKSVGAAYFLKKRMDQVISEEMDLDKELCVHASHDRLSQHAAEVTSCPLQRKGTNSAQEDMVFNGAYLVAEERLAGFQAELKSLVAKFSEHGYRFELVGPWPPYNFVTVGLGRYIEDEE